MKLFISHGKQPLHREIQVRDSQLETRHDTKSSCCPARQVAPLIHGGLAPFNALKQSLHVCKDEAVPRNANKAANPSHRVRWRSWERGKGGDVQIADPIVGSVR